MSDRRFPSARPVLDVDSTLLPLLTRTVEYTPTEQALRDSELRLNLALEASGDGLWDWNLVSGEVYLSPSYYALTGYRADEVVSDLAFFQRLVHPNDWPGVFATIGAHLRGESAISEIEYRMLTADGSEKWILGRGRVVARDAAGTPLRMIGHITDISACKRLERDFRESEARYRGVVEDQTEVIARIRADGTFVFANEIYCRLFGKRAEEVIGRKWQPNKGLDISEANRRQAGEHATPEDICARHLPNGQRCHPAGSTRARLR